MSEEKKTIELKEDELTKVAGESGLHFGIAEISMFTKDGIEIWDTAEDQQIHYGIYEISQRLAMLLLLVLIID